MLIPIQLLMPQTFKYSPLQALVVLGLNHHGLIRFIWKLLPVVLAAVVGKPLDILMLEAREEAVHLLEEPMPLNH
jgi:hypothetical protein